MMHYKSLNARKLIRKLLLCSALSAVWPFWVIAQTMLSAGDAAFIGIAANVGDDDLTQNCETTAGSERDRISLVFYKDIETGTVIDLTDNGWERRNVGEWGNSEGFLRIIRTGPLIKAGMTVTFELPISNTLLPVATAPDNGWQFQPIGVVNFNSGGGDQLYLLQGGSWDNGTGCPSMCQHNATYTGGRVICAFTNTGWLTTAPGIVNLAQRSRLHPALSACFAPSVSGDFVSYKMPQSATTQPVWTGRVRNAANWSSFPDCGAYVRPPDSFIVLKTVARLDCISNCKGCVPLNSSFRLNLLVPVAWGPFTLTYTDGTTLRTVNNVFDGMGFNLVSTQNTTYSIVSLTANNGCPVPFTYGGNGMVTTEQRPVIADKDTLVCTGTKIDLLGLVTPAPDRTYTFHTSPNPTAANILANPSVTVTTGVTYYGYVLTSTGCRDTFMLRFLTQPKGVAGTARDTLLCIPESGSGIFSLYETLRGATKGGVWSARPGDGLDPGTALDGQRGNLTTATLAEGTYAFTYTAPCDPLAKASVLVHIRKPPSFTGTVQFSNCAGNIEITAGSGHPPFVYDWADLNGINNPANRNGLATGMYELVMKDSNGCSFKSLFDIPVFVKDTVRVSQTTCDSVYTGFAVRTYSNRIGCDSVVLTTTRSLFVPPVRLYNSTCDASAIGQTIRHLTAHNGCDSLIITTTTLLPSDTVYVQAASCDKNQTGVTRKLLKNRFGCDSLVVTTTTLLPADTVYVQAASCDKNQTGVTRKLLKNRFGCDSLVVTTTTLLPSDTVYVQAASCDKNQTGVTRKLLKNRFGCDSLVVTTTTLLPSDTVHVQAASCDKNQTGVSNKLLKNRFGCDSLVATTTTLLPSDTVYVQAASCDKNQTGVTQKLLKNRFGCDSLVVTTTTLLPSDTVYVQAASCDKNQTGVTRKLLKNRFGCDSLVVTTTTLLPWDTVYVQAASCDKNQTGIAQKLLKNRFGCDSLVVTTTTLLPADTVYVQAASCDKNQTGVTQKLLKNRFGCDSLMITTTRLLRSDSMIVYRQTCVPSETGTRKLRLLNTAGCDSILTVITTLRVPDTTYERLFVCESAWEGVSARTFTDTEGCDSVVITRRVYAPPVATFLEETVCRKDSSGIFSKKTNSWRGCDSTIVTRRIYNPPDSTFLTAITCHPLESGIQVKGLISSNGCDSIVITEVDLLPTPSVYIEEYSCDLQAAGVRVQELTKADGCDSLVIITTKYVPPDTLYLRDSSCINEEAGRFIKVLKNNRGCDSILITDVQLLPFPEQTLRPKLCTGEYITVNGRRYDVHRRKGREILQKASVGGCDSIVNIDLLFSYLDVQLSSKKVTCHGGSDGSIFIDSIFNGKRPYSIHIDDVPGIQIQPPFTWPGLKAGWHRVYIEDAELCTYEDSIYLSEPPFQFISLPSAIQVHLGESVRLEPKSNFQIQQIRWSQDSSLSCTRCLSPVIKPFYSFSLSIEAADSNGCVVFSKTQIQVEKPEDVYVANVFMPERSDKNRLLDFSTGPSVKKITNFSIFDRWGNLVHRVGQVLPGDVSLLWDGRLSGQLLPAAVYVWEAEVEYLDGRVKKLKGDVTLVR